MIKYMKQTRLHITRYICGKPLYTNDVGVSVDRSGFPTKFIFLKEFLHERTDIEYFTRYRILFTLLLATRGIRATRQEDKKILPSYKTITDPFKGTNMGPIPTSFIQDFCLKYNLHSEKPTYSSKSNYLSSKGGPAGKSTWSSQWSPLSYTRELIDNLRYILGADAFEQLFMRTYTGNTMLGFSKGIMPLGKLSIIKDPEGKRRVIAMVDYHSQLALRSIHDILLNKLRNIPQDRTFTQDPFNSWKDSRDNYFSLDLSAATDRFPIKLQARLLSEIFQDTAYGDVWMSLLLNRDYVTPEGAKLRYSVGQPMGAYSSWAAFTLTHHLVISWCAFNCKIKDFNQYIILGDDIVIKDNNVAMKYIGIMQKLGVDISKPKTHVSKDTYEFAKRWIHRGVEVSGIPLKGIFSNLNHIRRLFAIIYDYLERIPSKRNLSSLQIFAKAFCGLKINKNKVHSYASIIRVLQHLYIGLRYSSNKLLPYELRTYILRNFRNINGYDLPSDNLILDLFKGIIGDGLTLKVNALTAKYTADIKEFEKRDDLRYIFNSAILSGMINHIDSLFERINGWAINQTPLVEIINLFTMPSADSLSRKDRDINLRIDELDSLIYKSIKGHFSGTLFPDNYYRVNEEGIKYLLPNSSTLMHGDDNCLSLTQPLSGFQFRMGILTVKMLIGEPRIKGIMEANEKKKMEAMLSNPTSINFPRLLDKD